MLKPAVPALPAMAEPDITAVEGLGICCRRETDLSPALDALFSSSKKEFHIIFFCDGRLPENALRAVKLAAERAKKSAAGLHISAVYSQTPEPEEVSAFPALDFSPLIAADCAVLPDASLRKKIRAAAQSAAACGRALEAVVGVSLESAGNCEKLFSTLSACGVRGATLLPSPGARLGLGGLAVFAGQLRGAVLSAHKRLSDGPPALQVQNTLGADEPGLRPADIVFCGGEYFHLAAWLAAADSVFALRVPKGASPSEIAAANPGPLESLAGKDTAIARAAQDWLRLCALINKICLDPGMGWTEASENPWFTRKLLCADIFAQRRFLRRNVPAIKAAFFFVPSACLNDCIFCQRKKSPRRKVSGDIANFLKANLALGHGKVAILGNEPLLEPRLPGIIAAAAKHGFSEIELLSSGAPLADRKLCRKLAACGLTALSIPLLAPSAGAHDAIVQKKGAFAATVHGIRNALDAGIKVHVHANALKQNLALLAELEQFVRGDLKTDFCIFPLRPKGSGAMNRPYAELMPSYSDIIAALSGKVHCLTGFPVCVERRIQGGAKVPAAALADSVKLYMLHQAYVKPPFCRDCRACGSCLGTFRQYIDLYSTRELSPVA